jgi:preprotein translocase subunit SecG
MIIEILTCFLLIAIILLQKAKSHGAGMAFGAAMGESLFGAQTGNILTKATVVLTIIFLLNTTILALMTPRIGGSVIDTVPITSGRAMPRATQTPHAPASAMPSMPEAPAGSSRMPAPVMGVSGPVVPAGGASEKADQPSPDAATSIPAKSGEQPSK